jgi:hypothetical protein
MYIPNYAGSSNKSVSIDAVTENNATAAEANLVAGLWSSTAAITSITLYNYGSVTNFMNTQPPPYTASKTPKKGKQ